MRCTHSVGAPPASVCKEDATWQDRCPAHGGTHPSTTELMTLLSKLTGWGDQSLSVDMGFKRRRDYDEQDDSYLNDRAWGFVVSTKIIGHEHAVGAQGATLEAALWSLCEAVTAKASDIGRRRMEDATKAQDALTAFLANRTFASPGIGPYR